MTSVLKTVLALLLVAAVPLPGSSRLREPGRRFASGTPPR